MEEAAIAGKRCTKCLESKSLSEFYASKLSSDGLTWHCKVCLIADATRNKKRYRQEGRYADKEKAYKDEYNRRYRDRVRADPELREAENARKRAWYAENIERARTKGTARHRWRRYGLSDEDFRLLVSFQNGRCASCGDTFGDETPQVDHDHVTLAVRGLTCGACNKAAGALKDDWRRARALARYLKNPPNLPIHRICRTSGEDRVRPQQ